MQVNPEQKEILYGQALDYAQLTGGESVSDAYCGIGTISLFLAQKAKEVYGIEIVPQAIEDAKRTADLNGIDTAYFEAGPAEVVISKWYADVKRFDVLVVDPPGKGCDEKLLNRVNFRAKLYISCSKKTEDREP